MGSKPLLVAVTGSEKPYVFDLPRLLAVPAGSEFRFRYKREWVAPEILADPGALKGCTLVAVFHSQESGHLIPVRCCTIKSVEVFGAIVYVKLATGEFPKVAQRDVETPPTNEELGAYTKNGRSYLWPADSAGQVDLQERLSPGMYCRIAADGCDANTHFPPAVGTDELARRWIATIEACAAAAPQYLGRLAFIHILGFQSKRRFFWCREKTLHLMNGKRYRLRVLEWCPGKSLGPIGRIGATNLGGLLVLEGASNLVVGRYDVLEFAFRTVGRGTTEVEVRMIPEQPGANAAANATAEWPVVYSSRLLVTVWPNVVKFAARCLALTCGMFMYLRGGALLWTVLGRGEPIDNGVVIGAQLVDCL